jgi:hypothetical protein
MKRTGMDIERGRIRTGGLSQSTGVRKTVKEYKALLKSFIPRVERLGEIMALSEPTGDRRKSGEIQQTRKVVAEGILQGQEKRDNTSRG